MKIKTSFLLNFLRYFIFINIELKDGYIIKHIKWFGFIDLTGDAIKADKAVFFDQSQGIFGKSISFGGLEKTIDDKKNYVKIDGKDYVNNSVMDIAGLSKQSVETIKQYLISNGSKIANNNGIEYKTKFPIFKYWRWLCPREIIRINSEGILHTWKNLIKTKSSYIPFEDVVLFSGNGLFRKKVTILGDVSVITKERISNKDYKELQERISKQTTSLCEDGKLYRASWLSFKTRKKTLFVLNNGFIYRDKKQAGFFEYKDIEKFYYKKNRWWWIFGTFTIEASRDDARNHSVGGGNLWHWEDSSHVMEIPGLPIWKWRILFVFKGPLKKQFKMKCKIAKVKEKMEAKRVNRANQRDYFN